MSRVLVIEDEQGLRRALRIALEAQGYDVDVAENGRRGLDLAARHHPDVIILDLGLPDIDGVDVAASLRGWSTTPIIVLSAREAEQVKVAALDAGADDYVTKPFNPRELVARVKAVLRRSEGAAHGGARPARRVGFAGWALDLVSRELQAPDGVVVQLSAGEFDLLRAFVENPQKVLNRDQLLDIARGRSAAPFDRSIDVQVSRLRRKIEPDPEKPTLIKTVRNGGYLFTAEVTPLPAERGA